MDKEFKKKLTDYVKANGGVYAINIRIFEKSAEVNEQIKEKIKKFYKHKRKYLKEKESNPGNEEAMMPLLFSHSNPPF